MLHFPVYLVATLIVVAVVCYLQSEAIVSWLAFRGARAKTTGDRSDARCVLRTILQLRDDDDSGCPQAPERDTAHPREHKYFLGRIPLFFALLLIGATAIIRSQRHRRS